MHNNEGTFRKGAGLVMHADVVQHGHEPGADDYITVEWFSVVPQVA